MPNPSARDSALRKVVATARSIVTYQVGLPVGVLRMSRALSWLKPHLEVPAQVISDYMRDTVELPLGTERLHASREALQRFDVRLESINRQYRDAIFDFCYNLLEEYGPEVDDVAEEAR